MEHFVWISVWTLTLFSCLQARPLEDSNTDLPFEDSSINYIRNNVRCPPNSRFYSPKNVQVQCIAAALECVKKELEGPITDKCHDNGYIDQAVEYLERMTPPAKTDNESTNSSGCECKKLMETPFSEFLDNMESLLEFKAYTQREQLLHQLH